MTNRDWVQTYVPQGSGLQACMAKDSHTHWGLPSQVQCYNYSHEKKYFILYLMNDQISNCRKVLSGCPYNTIGSVKSDTVTAFAHIEPWITWVIVKIFWRTTYLQWKVTVQGREQSLGQHIKHRHVALLIRDRGFTNHCLV